MTALRLRKLSCLNGDDCPAIDQTEQGNYLITGYRPGAPHTAENEITTEVPPTLLPELGHLRIPSITDWIRAHQTRDLIRLETLEHYDVASDDEDFHRYMRGEALPQSPAREAWYQRLREEAAAGKTRRRVRVARTPLAPYLRYECEWGFANNVAAGEDIRILDVTQHPAAESVLRTGDFFVADGLHVARHVYDDQGRLQGSAAVGADAAGAYAALAELAWQLATPFTQWWASHPQFHRAQHAA